MRIMKHSYLSLGKITSIRMVNVIRCRLSIDRESEEGLGFEDYSISVVLVKAYFLIRENSAIRVFLAFPPCGPKIDFKMLLK